jgi:glycosyltransferase involved in cell wall biosynthesis
LSGDKLRILFLLTQDLESPSGLGRYWPLARELAHRGHQVRIVALHSNYAALSERAIEKDGVQIDYVAPMHVQKQGSQKQYYSSFQLILVAMRASWALTRAALASPVDIIQVCKPHPMNSIAGLLAQRLRGGLICVDCDDYEAHSNRFGSGWQRKVVAYFEQHIPTLAQMVTTHTHYMRDKLLAWGTPENRIHYLSNGVDQARLTQPDPAAVSKLRNRLGLNGKRVVAYLGSMSLPSHPVDLLLIAFKVLHEQLSTTTLVLVGGGEDTEILIQLTHQLKINQDVIFIGRVSPQEIPLYYALAEVTVDPIFDNEAALGRSPLKMFESWIMGVPFITAAVGERVGIAGNPPACLMFHPVGNAEALAKAILRVLYSPELAVTLQQRGLERVKNFRWDILATRLERLYQGLI